MSMQRALILDCDGVLADTELDGHLVAFNQVFEEIGADFRWTPEEYKDLLRVGGGKERLLAYLRQHPRARLSADGEELAATVAKVHKRKSSVYVSLVESGALPGRPGVARLITEALDCGWIVAVASTSALSSVEAVLKSVVGAPTRARMAGVFAGDVVAAKKPAPDIYLLALDSLGLDPAQVVVIEDSQAGAAAAAAAGLAHVVTVSHFTVDDDFPAATTVVTHLGESSLPASTMAGPDLRDDSGVISVDSLGRALLERASH